MSQPPASAPMSTPITQLSSTAAASAPIEDINVLSVIDEMQQIAAPQAPAAAPRPIMMPPHYMAHQPKVAATCPWMDRDRGQKALIAAAIALAIFYPGTMQAIYSKLPKFESIFTSYDLIIRALLFAVVIYILLWKLDC